MQKLKQRTKRNTPTNTPLVRGNCGLQLNREEILSVADLKTCSNNPEVDPTQHTGGLKAKVYVISITGEVLMPCSSTKARKLLKNKRAKIIKLYPFTIQLIFECENQIQSVTLGIDSGYKNLGFSCVTEKEELISGTLILDSRTSSRLTEKRMYRKLRRNKLWYRKPRFLNRKRREGWLPPSIQRRYDTHLKLISCLKLILPISKIIVETAKFDIQKIENPNITGVDYQQGNMYGYQNLRGYLISRERGSCQLCKKRFEKGESSHIHHCKEKSKQGSNSVKNLAILHKKCHIKLHKQGLKLKVSKQYKQNTFMSIINKRFKQDIPNLNVTFGYITFIKRNELGLLKTHYTDAFIIAGGSNQKRITDPITIKQKHRNNRSLQLNRRGFKPSIRRKRYSIQPKDLVWIAGKKYVTNGVHCAGCRVIVEETKKSYPIKKVQKVYNFGGFAYNK